MSRAVVGLVLVAHSEQLAEGVQEVAEQMAPDVRIRAAGGCPDGVIGTSFERVETAVRDLLGLRVDAVLLLTDLGSATLTAEAVIEILDDPRVSLVEGPLVEGAIAAAVAAQGGFDAAGVRRAVLRVGIRYGRMADGELAGLAVGGIPVPVGAAQARRGGSPRPHHGRERGPGLAAPPKAVERVAVPERGPDPAAAVQRVNGVERSKVPELRRTLHLSNRLGLHARPAALLARTTGAFDASVSLNGVPATSVLELMSLGLELGAELHVAAAGLEAEEALDAVEELVSSRFGEE